MLNLLLTFCESIVQHFILQSGRWVIFIRKYLRVFLGNVHCLHCNTMNWFTKSEMTIKLCDTNRVHSNSDCQMANFDEMRRNDINHFPLLDTRQSFVLDIQVWIFIYRNIPCMRTRGRKCLKATSTQVSVSQLCNPYSNIQTVFGHFKNI